MRASVSIVGGALVTLAGCSEPNFSNCKVTCAADSDCPSGLTCSAGYCLADPDQACAARPDAMPPLDSIDAGHDVPQQDGAIDPPGEFVPSNGLGNPAYLDGVTGALSAQLGDPVILDTETGEIQQGMVVLRAAGNGVVDDIYFSPHPDGIGSIFGFASVDLGVKLEVLGDRALHMVSAGDVHITDIIDVSAGCHFGSVEDVYCGGPGGGDGDPGIATICGSGTTGQDGNGGAGGGHGQAGAGGIEPACSEVTGGPVCGMASLEPLVGGGGGGISAESTAFGGGGGGAIQIASYTTIVIGAESGAASGINANGQGGEGQFGGGAGGGAGGAILLEAPAITLRGTAGLAANGGGGGCGSSNGNGEEGRFFDLPALGGCLGGTSPGGDGGARGAEPTSSSCAGGAGGGAGRIRINTFPGGLDNGSNFISPAPTFGNSQVQ